MRYPWPDGGVTAPGGSQIELGIEPKTTITIPSGGGEVKPAEGGGAEVPDGTTVKTGDGPEVTVGPGNGGTIGGGGGVTVPDGGKVTVKGDPDDTTITLPSGGGTIQPRPDGTVVLPGGSTVTKPDGETVTVPGSGGTYDPGTGAVTENSGSPSGGGSSGGSSGPATYPPTVERPGEGGGVTVSPSRPKRGDAVTVRPEPDAGYEVEKVTVTDRNGKAVQVERRSNGTYSFIQSSGKVKIEITFKPVKLSWSDPFTDVPEGAWYYDAVRFVSESGLMEGYGDGTFGPGDDLSRAQLAQILFNREGRPVVDYLMRYGDMAPESWYAEAVRWAASQGIVSGYGDGTFGPDDPITREQLAVMLWRYAGSPTATNKELRFADAGEASGYALEALRWAAEKGILHGYGDGRLAPKGPATRAQVAQVLKDLWSSEAGK